MNIQIEFGKRVKEVRRKKGMSQEELSRISGLNRNYVSDVERGKRNISLQSVSKIAEGLSIEVKELF